MTVNDYCESYAKKYSAIIAQESISRCYCNICGYRFKKFLRFGKRENARCPVCNSLERHRHMYIYIQPLAILGKGKRILHFAPESVFKHLFLSAEGLDYFNADLEESKGVYQVDMTAMQFDSNFFDFILASHVLEHIVDDASAMSELYRVLKPGGSAILSVPFLHQYRLGIYKRTDGSDLEHLSYDNPELTYEVEGANTPGQRFKLYGQSNHVRIYALNDFCRRLEKAGFTIELSSPTAFSPTFRAEANIVDDIVIAKK